jgi:deoxyadenosine/deoxycytidine kinase
MQNLTIKMNWKKIIFPILDNFTSINNDESGSIIISKNNWDLAHNPKDYEKVINEIDKHRNNQKDNKDTATIIVINKS